MDNGDIERLVEALGFEVVTLDRGGGKNRPILRLRIDRQGGVAGRSTVSVEDTAAVTRALRAEIEAGGDDARSWVLEVSSPGVDRPLVRPSDFERFKGERIRVRGYGPLAGGAKQLEGTLLGLVSEDGEAFALDTGAERVEIPLDAVASARLHYVWGSGVA